MATDNSLNTGKGSSFQTLAAKMLSEHLSVEFRLDYAIAIGKPPKLHRFDLVSTDVRFVGECKNYSWTETGNTPSAKMGFVNEAILLPIVSASRYRAFYSDATRPAFP